MKTRLYPRLLLTTLLTIAASGAWAGNDWFADQGRDAQREIQRDLQRELRRNLKPITPTRPEVEEALPSQPIESEQPAQKVSAA